MNHALMRIGICGGTFDPFHLGHLDPILAVRGAMGWERILFIPAFVQPFKTDRVTASPYHRFSMAAIATVDHDGVLVSPMELERGAISYTVDTLAALRAEYPEATLDWIIGDDNLAKLTEWKSIDTIVQLANFTVLTRIGGAAPASPPSALPGGLKPAAPRGRPTRGAIVFAENAAVPVSSTEVRRRVQAGLPVDDLVPPVVSRYIQQYELYRKGHS
jgi:nicotinate-nucleotide adenylyltransferase